MGDMGLVDGGFLAGNVHGAGAAGGGVGEVVGRASCGAGVGNIEFLS